MRLASMALNFWLLETTGSSSFWSVRYVQRSYMSSTDDLLKPKDSIKRPLCNSVVVRMAGEGTYQQLEPSVSQGQLCQNQAWLKHPTITPPSACTVL